MIWNSLGSFTYLFAQWVFTYLVTNALGFTSAGVYSLAVSVTSTFYMVSAYSMRNYQVSDIHHDYSDSTYIRSRYLTSLIAFILCMLFSCASGYDASTLICIALYMLYKMTEGVSDAYQGVMQLRMRMDYIGKSFIFKGVLELAVFGAALYLIKDLPLSLAALFACSTVIVLLYDARRARTFYLSEPARRPEGWNDVLSLLKTCLPAAVFGLLFTAAGQLPRIFIERQLGAEMLGYYSSIAMPTTIIQVSANFIFAPLATPLAQAFDTGDTIRFTSMIKRVLLAIFAIMFLGICGFLLFGDWFYSLLYGAAIKPYVMLSIPLVISCALVATSWFLSTILMVLRKLKPLMVASAIACAITLFGSKPFLALFDLNGATFIYIAALVAFIATGILAVSHGKVNNDHVRA